jgi:hypothetical protein
MVMDDDINCKTGITLFPKGKTLGGQVRYENMLEGGIS